MKSRIIAVSILLVLCIVLAAGWWWARTSPQEAVRFLTDRGLDSRRAQELVSALGAKAASPEETPLVASGSIEGEEVAVVSEYGGKIAAINVAEGDEVQAGEVMVELDTSLLLAQKAQAEAAVSVAEANLKSVQAGTHPAEILAAEAALGQAIAQRDGAETALQDARALLENPQQLDAQIAQAEAAVNVAKTQIDQCKAKLAEAEVLRDQYKAQGSLQEKGLYAVNDYQVQAAQSALDSATAGLEGAEENLAALTALRDHPLAAISQVHLAESQYTMAVAGVAVAQAKLVELKAGPTSEQVAVAQAQVAQAESAVAAVETQIAKRTLTSPISGVVTSISAHTGEAAVAGSQLLSIADLDEVKLVIYVPENELGRVYLGQEAQVQVDSFPARGFPGVVSHISQQAEFTPKNVQTEEERVNMVFAVTVHVPNPDHLLKPGMPADAVLGD